MGVSTARSLNTRSRQGQHRRRYSRLFIITVRQRSWGKVMFSIVFVCQSFCPGGVPYDHYPWCFGTLQAPHHTRTPPLPLYRDLTIHPTSSSCTGTSQGQDCPSPIWDPLAAFCPKILRCGGDQRMVIGEWWGYHEVVVRAIKTLPYAKELFELFALTGSGVT